MKNAAPLMVVGLVIGIVAGAASTWFLLAHAAHEDAREDSHEDAREGAHEVPEKAEGGHPLESRVVRVNEHTLVRVDKEMQERCGLKLESLQPAALKPEAKAFGHVIDPVPLAALVAEVATCQAALNASSKELERLKVLVPDQNASTRALEMSAVQVERDQIAVDAAQLRLRAAWGKDVASRKDLGPLAAALAGREQALIRLDLPAGETLKGVPTEARVAPFGSPDRWTRAEVLATAADVDPQTQGQGFLALVSGASLTPGTAVTAWLTLSGEERKGVVLPRAAIVRHEGESFVYVQNGEDLFERKKVELGRPTESGWFVEGDLEPGSRIVLTGGQQLLSEELKGQGGEEE